MNGGDELIQNNLHAVLQNYVHSEDKIPDYVGKPTIVQTTEINGMKIPTYINEFWTSAQRQASSIHEISYRACFKAQLPRFFISLLSHEQDVVYDPFAGRGTTLIEAGLLRRNIILNDVNPLSHILAKPRFFIPTYAEVQSRLNQIPMDPKARANIDVSMFYHPATEAEIVSLQVYLTQRRENEDAVDRWIQMVATNRLTGHSTGFFSVYTLPPNQAVSAESQKKINRRRNQTPSYKPIAPRILKKTKSLLRNISTSDIQHLKQAGLNGTFLTKPAHETPEIHDESVQLTITSPPFLNVVQYPAENWLRCWFNRMDSHEIGKRITITRKLEDWLDVMGKVFNELYRITKPLGWIAFEVGEVHKGQIKLDEHIIPVGKKQGFTPVALVLNAQQFTKTSNIWGIKNNQKGTNSNRIVLFQKKIIRR